MARKRPTGGLFECELPRVEYVSLKEALRRPTLREQMESWRRRAEERAKSAPPPIV